jgi:predicted esterase
MSNLHSAHITVAKTARYYLSQPIDDDTSRIVFVLHGYAQLAGDFLAQFEPLFIKDTVFVAPEGLNRFYAKGFGGKPAATWMTSEDREHETKDYVNYLDTLYRHIVPPHFTGRIDVLGFSQGVATASRWIHQSAFKFHSFIMCSGDIAIELRNPVSEKLKAMKTIYITAENDPLLKHETKKDVMQVVEELGSIVYIFCGGHELHLQSVKKALYENI